nr:unnamed protein product [Callosobruchus chinensis]
MHQPFATDGLTLLSEPFEAVLGSPKLWKVDVVLHPQIRLVEAFAAKNLEEYVHKNITNPKMSCSDIPPSDKML